MAPTETASPDLKRIVLTPGAQPSLTGSELHCKDWHAEGALRMFLNNLHADVAERPEDLVVYGGTGKAARTWEDAQKIVDTLQRLEVDETMLVQSGKPVAVFRTHKWAPKVLIANSNLVGKWSTWEHFRELEDRGLMMYGQMTAGSWIYIGTQGILQGTYETFAAMAEKLWLRRRDLKGRLVLTGGARRHGRRPAAGRHDERGRGLPAFDVDEQRIRRSVWRPSGTLDEMPTDLDEALDHALRAAAKEEGRALSVGVARQRGGRAEPSWCERGSRAGRAHRPDLAHDPV